MKIRILSMLSFMLLNLSNVQAADLYDFEKGHSRIFFQVNHLGFSEFNGMFREFSGSFKFDEKDVSKSSLKVSIDVASVDTFHTGLNDHLRNEDFFDTAKFPEAVFISKKVKSTGDKTFEVIGELTLKGVSKPLTLNVTLNKAAPHPMNKKKYIAGFSAYAALDRTDFGMTYAVPNVGKEVRLEIDVEGQKQTAK